jgi:hypothetical protein
MTNIFIAVFVAGMFTSFYLNNKKKVDKTADGIKECLDIIDPK